MFIMPYIKDDWFATIEKQIFGPNYKLKSASLNVQLNHNPV